MDGLRMWECLKFARGAWHSRPWRRDRAYRHGVAKTQTAAASFNGAYPCAESAKSLGNGALGRTL